MRRLLLSAFSVISLVWFITFNASTQIVTQPNQAVGLSYEAPNILAAKYLDERMITDPVEIRFFHEWYNGLDTLGISTNDILYMCSFRDLHHPATNATIYPMIGPTTTIIGTLTNYNNGYVFDGSGNNYIRITNTFPALMTNYTMVVACEAQFTGGAESIVGGYDSVAAGDKGPMLWAHGSPSASYVPGYAYAFWSPDGIANGTGWGTVNGLVSSRQITGGPQLQFHGFSPTKVSMKNGMNPFQETTVSGYGPAANNADNWYVGRLVNTTALALNGEVAFFMLLNKYLGSVEQNELRKLYTRTIGQTYIPRVNLYIDGDSLTAGAGGEFTWRQHLGTNVIWGNYTTHRSVAVAGTPVANGLTRWTNDLARFEIDKEYATRQYYFNWFGIIDINNLNTNTPALLLSSQKVLYALARQAGMKVVAFTLSYSFNTATNAIYRQNWTNYNLLLKSAFPYYDHLIRIDEDVRLTNYADTNYFNIDQVHFTSLGEKVIEVLITTAIPYP